MDSATHKNLLKCLREMRANTRGRVDGGLCAYSIGQTPMKEAQFKREDQLRAPETSHAFVLKAMLSSRCPGVGIAALGFWNATEYC